MTFWSMSRMCKSESLMQTGGGATAMPPEALCVCTTRYERPDWAAAQLLLPGCAKRRPRALRGSNEAALRASQGAGAALSARKDRGGAQKRTMAWPLHHSSRGLNEGLAGDAADSGTQAVTHRVPNRVAPFFLEHLKMTARTRIVVVGNGM